MTRWLVAFLFTQLVEMPVYSRFLDDRPWARRLEFAFLPSLVTHPVVWFGFPRLMPGNYYAMIAVAEAFAIGVEALILGRCGVKRPLAVSMVANGASAGLGFLSRGLFGWP